MVSTPSSTSASSPSSSLSAKLPSLSSHGGSHRFQRLTSYQPEDGPVGQDDDDDRHDVGGDDHQVITIELVGQRGGRGDVEEGGSRASNKSDHHLPSTTAGSSGHHDHDDSHKDRLEAPSPPSVMSHDDTPPLISAIDGTLPPPKTRRQWIEYLLWSYWRKFQGVPDKQAPPMTPFLQMLVSSILGFIGIFLVSVTDYWYLSKGYQFNGKGLTMLTGAYAATAGKLIALIFLLVYMVLIVVVVCVVW